VKLRLITEPTPELASTAEFTDAMTALASGVVIVTCRLDGRPWGMTVTAFASVSADAPTVLVSLGSGSIGARAIAETRSFGVSILAEDQLVLARFGSTPRTAKFLEPFAEPGDEGSASPVVAGALAHLDCELSEAVPVADHTVYFGRVRIARSMHAGSPLLYHRRDYRTLAEPAAERRTTCLAN
jgi:flavin reductase (DIM6/NTAB) family NADH-FMN oxidoreductase RutF